MATYIFPPTKAKINALAHRIKQMSLPSTTQKMILSSLRALYVIPNTPSNMSAISYLQSSYYAILDHYNIEEISLLD